MTAPIMLPEQWLPVVDFEGLYDVSDHARVRTVERMIHGSPGSMRLLPAGFLSVQRDRHGYDTVKLWRDGKRTHHGVHVLVATAFLDRPEDADLVRHLNDNRRQNGLHNLAWGTWQDNIDDRLAITGHYQARWTHCLREHLLAPPNLTREVEKSGARQCLACARARGRVRRAAEQGVELNLQAVSDAYYAEIMKEVAA